MARQRFIWPDLWADPDLGRVSPLAFILYVGCFSLADDEGRLIADPTFLKSAIFPYRRVSDREIRAARDELVSACSAFHVYESREIEYVALLNWSTWQKPKYPRPSKLPAPPRSVQTAYLRRNSSGKSSGTVPGSVGERVPNASGNDSPVGWDGLGSTPKSPSGGKSRARGTNPRARGTNPRSRAARDEDRNVIELRQGFARFVAGAGWDESFDEGLILEELERIRASQYVDDDGTFSVAEAVQIWKTERDRRYSTVEA